MFCSSDNEVDNMDVMTQVYAMPVMDFCSQRAHATDKVSTSISCDVICFE